MQIHKLKIILIPLSLIILGGCTKTVMVLREPPASLLILPPPVTEPTWKVTGDLLTTIDLYKTVRKSPVSF